ncbi:hypothetical protein BJV82DRAFT_615871 [Fennellomyces sp. T-0311]|nr:hypothetical protein BJV82DRAFT_615871 [Fennellomyces sp. T-0311]
MQPEQWNILQAEVQAKCITYEYADSGDDTLAQYIINLLKIGSSLDHVNQELQQLVGSDYNIDLTDWIFSRANELENPAPPSEPAQTKEPAPADDAARAAPQRRNRIFAQAIGDVSRGANGASARSTRSRSRSPDSRRRVRERSPSRSSRNGDYNRGSTSPRSVVSRLGPSNGRQVQITSSNGSPNSRPSVFDRLGGAKPAASSHKVERCKYWPSCSQGESCQFFHPKTICPDFPHCSKPAIECMFIHPEVAMQQPPVMPPVQTMLMKRPIPCKFYPYCTNPMCPFMHPEEPAGAPPVAVPVKRVPIPCKMGDQCKRPGCHFMHPGDKESPVSEILCKYDGSCTRPGCFYKHTVPPVTFTPGNKSLILNKKESESTSERQFSVAEDSVVERIVLGESADLIKKETGKADVDNDTAMEM